MRDQLTIVVAMVNAGQNLTNSEAAVLLASLKSTQTLLKAAEIERDQNYCGERVVDCTCVPPHRFALGDGYCPEYVKQLEEKLEAARSILWMAEQFAEGGGSHGPEQQEYDAAMAIIEGKDETEDEDDD